MVFREVSKAEGGTLSFATQASASYHQAPWRRAALVAIKAIHSLIYFTLEFCVGYLLYSGLTKRQDRTTAIAAAAIGAESLIYFGNGRRCPLTGLAEGARGGSRLGD